MTVYLVFLNLNNCLVKVGTQLVYVGQSIGDKTWSNEWFYSGGFAYQADLRKYTLGKFESEPSFHYPLTIRSNAHSLRSSDWNTF